ncbi:conserved hypothetical protein [Luminiphilus syltensis NOR5-1B]|uniref:DUF885 domain-containing protein n=1 Tax=Luminiphilus syltensis NOR5-1B TaxID=565045 RepID=B8KS40_9GAMM|nr:conserved hypothetical protein [Luminiphilus syltensis NOR5-1B]
MLKLTKHRFGLTEGLVLLLALAFAGTGSAAGPLSDDAILDQLIDGYIATERSAGGLEPVTLRAFEQRLEKQTSLLAALENVDESRLSFDGKIDRKLLRGILEADIETAKKRRPWATVPTLYLPASLMGETLKKWQLKQLTDSELMEFLGRIGPRIKAARANLEAPPRRFTESAIFQLQQLLVSLETVTVKPDSLLAQSVAATVEQLQAYLLFLQKTLLPLSNGDWAIGREHYSYILSRRWHMDTTAEAIIQRGENAFAETEALAQAASERLDPGKHWSEVYDALTASHPSAAGLKEAYQNAIDSAQAFVLEQGIVSLPRGEQVVTLDTPPYMRRSSPYGTFDGVDPFGTELVGRLLLTPIEEGLDAEAREQRLRGHHSAWIPVIAVHEAYPGHHVHALKIRENPRPLRRVVHEPIFSEGWGLFTEELMFEAGFLEGDAVRLTQLRNRLWRAARVILDASLHSGAMSFDEAVQFLVDRVRFDPMAASLEVGMYIRNPTYVLGYLIGMQEIAAIRDDFYRINGQPEHPRDFYDELLKTGAMPPALVREVMFRDSL